MLIHGEHHSPPFSGLAIQPVLNPAKSVSIQDLGASFFQENAVGNGVSGFIKSKQGDQVGKQDLPFLNPC